jgi:hypothetical protein
VQFFLKVLVHHVNHPVAKSPKGKQENEPNKGEEDILAVIGDEHALTPWRHNDGKLREKDEVPAEIAAEMVRLKCPDFKKPHFNFR